MPDAECGAASAVHGVIAGRGRARDRDRTGKVVRDPHGNDGRATQLLDAKVVAAGRDLQGTAEEGQRVPRGNAQKAVAGAQARQRLRGVLLVGSVDRRAEVHRPGLRTGPGVDGVGVAGARPHVDIAVDDDRGGGQRAVATEAPEDRVGREVDRLQRRPVEEESGRTTEGRSRRRAEAAERGARRGVQDGVANQGVADVELAVVERRRLAAATLAAAGMVPEQGAVQRLEVIGLGAGIGDIDAGGGHDRGAVVAVHHRRLPGNCATARVHRIERAARPGAAGVDEVTARAEDRAGRRRGEHRLAGQLGGPLDRPGLLVECLHLAVHVDGEDETVVVGGVGPPGTTQVDRSPGDGAGPVIDRVEIRMGGGRVGHGDVDVGRAHHRVGDRPTEIDGPARLQRQGERLRSRRSAMARVYLVGHRLVAAEGLRVRVPGRRGWKRGKARDGDRHRSDRAGHGKHGPAEESHAPQSISELLRKP